MCGGSILSCCPRNPYGHERALKEEEDFYLGSSHSVDHISDQTLLAIFGNVNRRQGYQLKTT